ncbi:MAG: hypothetical protein EAX96_10235 [Candidatus Lokiarchaeota archaeon]|nr:hypothetical protein [Candidatus Lokiarchaeota archaeon]
MPDFLTNEIAFHVIKEKDIIYSKKFAIIDKKLKYVKACELDFFEGNNLFEGFVVSSLNHKLRIPTHIKFGEGNAFEYILLFIDTDYYLETGYLPILLSMGKKGKGHKEIWGGERRILSELSKTCVESLEDKKIDNTINRIMRNFIEERYDTLEKKSRERFLRNIVSNKNEYTVIWAFGIFNEGGAPLIESRLYINGEVNEKAAKKFEEEMEYSMYFGAIIQFLSSWNVNLRHIKYKSKIDEDATLYTFFTPINILVDGIPKTVYCVLDVCNSKEGKCANEIFGDERKTLSNIRDIFNGFEISEKEYEDPEYGKVGLLIKLDQIIKDVFNSK